MPESFAPLSRLLQSLAHAENYLSPYPHWLLSGILPDSAIDAICALPFAAPQISDTMGRRETNNSTRQFFSPREQADFPVCAALASAFQGRAWLNALQKRCGINLTDRFLRIEYCQDVNGFWLEPHTDIGAKFFTMLIYLNDSPPGEAWGTDIYETPDHRLGPAPAGRNQGLIFIPSQNSWHGFEQRPITGIRRSLIVNYVTPAWRARHELAFPEQPVQM